MITSFTPGPWIHEPDDGANIACTDGYAICDMAYEYSSIPRDELEANARLITASPDLLQMLKDLVDLEGPQPGNSAWGTRALALIAKIEGGAA